MKLSIDDFGSVCIYALRYCQGRRTYAPEHIVKIVTAHLKEFSDKDIAVMISDCEYQRRIDNYGDSEIDRPVWLEFEKMLKKEREARKCQS